MGTLRTKTLTNELALNAKIYLVVGVVVIGLAGYIAYKKAETIIKKFRFQK